MSSSLVEQVDTLERPGEDRGTERGADRQLSGLLSREGLGRWAGLGLIAAGAVVLAIAWGRSSELADVPRQMPLLISGGFAGLGLVVVGVTVIAIDVSVRRSAERRQRADAMAAAVARLHRTMGEQG